MNSLKGALVTLGVTILLLAVSPPSARAQTTASATPDTLNCTGYPQPRIFLESQAWWKPQPGQTGTNFGHVHIGTCFPYRQTLSGKVDFDIRVIMHDNPGTLATVEIQLFGKSGGKIVARVSNLNTKCPNPGTCTMWYHLTADTSLFPSDGRQEFRFHAIVNEPDGNRLLASTGWQAYLKNGNPVADYRSTDAYTEARGWYTNEGYTQAKLTSLVPQAPVSGTWNFSAKLSPGSGGNAVNHCLVLLDPCFHCIPASLGTVLYQGNSSYYGTFKLDTTKISNGPHKILLRSDAPALDKNSTSSGVMVIPFVVKN